MGSSIVVAGQHFDIEHPVLTFEDRDGYSAYVKHRTDVPSSIYPTHPAQGMENKEARYRERRFLEQRSLSALKRGVRQVVVHLDGCLHAKMCFDVLHNQHGLSVHFLVDNDGTIYQTLDLADCAFHAAGVNERSIGIELANRGDAARFPGAYKDGARETVTCTVHDTLFLAYDYTKAQYEGMTKLAAGLARILDIPLTSPRGSDGAPHRTLLPSPADYPGFIGHYNITREKWDPGPWDFQRMFRRVSSRVTFPLTSPERLRPQGELDPKRFEAEADRYFVQTETLAPGRFPIGPSGESRLWHAGVHLVGGRDAPVYAPMPGRVVAARYSPPSRYGSTAFVLVKHTFETETDALPFFTLYFHLRGEGSADAPPWLARTPDLAGELDSGRLLLLDTAIGAGELIGHLGEAGPPEQREPQIHFAIFAEENVAATLDPSAFQLVDGGTTSRFAPKAIVRLFDRAEDGKPPDGLVSRRELAAFFRGDARAREELRQMVVRHLSEWTVDGWEATIDGAPDFRALSSDERRRLYEEQIRPTSWWSDSVARHSGLPSDGVVFSYHPIGFLAWYEALMRRRADERSRGIAEARGDEVVGDATARFKLDSESTVQMTDASDSAAPPPRRGLTIEEMLEGYGD